MRWFALAAALVVASGRQEGVSHAPLDQPLTATDHVIYAPAGDLATPSDASEIGLLSRIFRAAGAPFGFETDERNQRPTSGAPVEPHIFAARTLREALDSFVKLDPRYEWRDANGVIVVRARAAWMDPRDALNQPVHDIDWSELDPVAAFNHVARLLYPDAHDPFEGLLPMGARRFDVRLRQGTVLDVLNAAARADGELGWIVLYGAGGTGPRVTLTIGHYGSGPTASWPEPPRVK
jgi:hypothetical protein